MSNLIPKQFNLPPNYVTALERLQQAGAVKDRADIKNWSGVGVVKNALETLWAKTFLDEPFPEVKND